MADLTGAIKRIISDYLRNEDLADVLYATYTGTGLKIDGRPNEIPAAFVDVPLSLQTVTAKLSGEFSGDCLAVEGAPVTKITLTDAEITLTRGLAVGDRVMVVKQQGGSRYSIIDRLGAK